VTELSTSLVGYRIFQPLWYKNIPINGNIQQIQIEVDQEELSKLLRIEEEKTGMEISLRLFPEHQLQPSINKLFVTLAKTNHQTDIS